MKATKLNKFILLFLLSTIIIDLSIFCSSCSIDFSEKDVYDKLLPNIFLFIVNAISILVLLLLTFVLLYNPLKKVINKRKQEFEKENEQTRILKEETIRKLVDAERKRMESFQEANLIINQAKQESAYIFDSIMEQAKNESETTLIQGKKEVNEMKKKVVENNNKYIFDASVAIAEKLMKKSITKKDNDKYVNDFLKSFNKKIKK